MRKLSYLLSFLLIPFMGAVLLAAPQQVDREWVVQSILRSDSATPGFYAYWGGVAESQGDQNGDGLGEFYLQYDLVPHSTSSGSGRTNWFALVNGATMNPLVPVDAQSHFRGDNSGNLLLHTPNEIVLASLGYLEYPTTFKTWHLHPFGLANQGYVPPTPPRPELHGLYFLFRGGDINHDGWEDFFFNAHIASTSEFVAGMVDGKSLDVRWQYRRPYLYKEKFCEQTGFGSSPDLDGDGIPDSVASCLLMRTYGVLEYDLIALSGVDGSVIWERIAPQPQRISTGTESAMSSRSGRTP